MAKKPIELIYNADHIIDHEIDDDTIRSIGAIALTGAELDDLLSAVIFDIAKINPSDGYLLLGRSAISGKSQVYGYLLEKYAGVEAAANFKTMRTPLKQFLDYRNSICHGVYLGKHEESGALLFLRTADNMSPENGATVQKMSGFTSAQINAMAKLGPTLLSYFRAPFGGRSSREIHVQRLRQGPPLRPKSERENNPE